MTTALKRPHYPDNEVFELTLDFDAPENQPLEMVRRDGHDIGWNPKGQVVTGTQTRRFKWVSLGYCRTFYEVVQKLASHGKIPEGQWREAVKAAFESDGEHPRGIADATRVSPYCDAYFPYVRSNGDSHFNGTDHDFGGYWRWLVEVSE